MKPITLATAKDQSFDAIIIGSGAGGSTVAWRLVQAGKRVLVVERGGMLVPDEMREGAPPGKYMYDIHAGQNPAPSFVGGLTKFYGAALYRFRESDFSEVQHNGAVSPAWPMSYAELEPYYTAAEELFKVHGSPEGDPSEPPRSKPYPYAPIPHAPLMQRIADRLTRAGVANAPVPRGLDVHSGGNCILCATCDAHFCQRDAKWDADTAALRPAFATGKLSLLIETECLRVLTDATGKRAESVLLRQCGVEATLKAPSIIVAAGIPESALLLRRSRNAQHPEGLGNQGALGRYMGGHSVGMIFPIVSRRPIGPTHTKSFAINAYYNRTDTTPAGIIQTAGQVPFWRDAGKVMKPVAYMVSKLSAMCFYMTEALPSANSGLHFDGDKIARREEPVHDLDNFYRMRTLAMSLFARAGYKSLARKRPPYLWHEIGTARMGDDAKTSVVDANLQVHGIAGLYVTDASVLPSAGAVNTGLTIIALALRAGEHIAARSAA